MGSSADPDLATRQNGEGLPLVLAGLALAVYEGSCEAESQTTNVGLLSLCLSIDLHVDNNHDYSRCPEGDGRGNEAVSLVCHVDTLDTAVWRRHKHVYSAIH